MDLSEVEKLDSPVKTLKLSEAIRIGARLRPQCFGATASNGASCANMAAAEAMWMKYQEGTGVDDVLVFLSGHGFALLKMWEVIDMNDKLHMPREQIADWLEARGY